MSDVPIVSFDNDTFSVVIADGVTLSWKVGNKTCSVKLECGDMTKVLAVYDNDLPVVHPVLQ
jgi:hypothetical protein